MSENVTCAQIDEVTQKYYRARFAKEAPTPLIGAQLKLQGLSRASLSRKELLCAAKMFAHAIAQKRGSCTIDDVQAELEAQGFTSADLGNAAGGVFRGKDWECVGSRQSKRVSAHARRILVWMLRHD